MTSFCGIWNKSETYVEAKTRDIDQIKSLFHTFKTTFIVRSFLFYACAGFI
jgi:hypothetical protein